MKTLFIEYPKCTTCRKAKKFLKENNVDFEVRDIIKENPTKNEILKWMEISGLEAKKFFNTSGVLYREMNLKDKVKNISNEEAAEILSTNGMLIKRPVLIKGDIVVLGFKDEIYKGII